MFQKTIIIFSLLSGIFLLSNTLSASELSQVKPYMNSIQTANKTYVPFGSVKIKTINKPTIIVACERSYTATTSKINMPSGVPGYKMNVYRHTILDGKLSCEYEGYPPGEKQARYATKYLPTPEGTTCSTISDFKFSCENKKDDTCPTTCKRK